MAISASHHPWQGLFFKQEKDMLGCVVYSFMLLWQVSHHSSSVNALPFSVVSSDFLRSQHGT